MDQDEIRRFMVATFPGVDTLIASEANGAPQMAWGDTFFIYDPDHVLEGAKQFPFATIVTQDYGEFDNASNLDRPGVFRLNIGLGRETFDSLFEAGAEHDFTALDTLMPHPVYGANHWVSILNPSDESIERVRPLLREAYDRVAGRYASPSR